MKETRVDDARLVRGLFLGFIKMHILHHARKEPIYGKEFRRELEHHGYEISYGTLYPIFHGLEQDGYLGSEKRKVDGKIRKYYRITDKGLEVFEVALDKVRELTNELFE
jgi:DNA-binding PadR family transcriptional regulator